MLVEEFTQRDVSFRGAVGLAVREPNAGGPEAWVRRATARGELSLVYEPILSLRTGGVLGFEALLRWRRGSGETVSPSRFIPFVESSPRAIRELGAWVLDEACRSLAECEGTAPSSLRVAVNTSAHQLEERGFADSVLATLTRTGLTPERLALELTETVPLLDLATARKEIAVLRRVGVHFVIDDFGVGHASFRYLEALPVDKVKLPPRLVTRIGESAAAGAAIHELGRRARERGAVLLAEGAWRPRQLAELRRLGVSEVQSYFLAQEQDRPVARRCVAVPDAALTTGCSDDAIPDFAGRLS